MLAAGLLAHIDIRIAETASNIWSYAGLNPNQKWEKGEKRPWNAGLRTLCWKLGQSFMKVSNREDATYGRHYRDRKTYEIERNDSGGNAEAAARILAEKKWGKATEAFKHLSAGKLPPAQIDARARRYAVKLFLAHFHKTWRELEGLPVRDPYPVAHLVADRYRPDLEKAGIGDGRLAFELELSAGLAADLRHEIEVRRHHDAVLEVSPRP